MNKGKLLVSVLSLSAVMGVTAYPASADTVTKEKVQLSDPRACDDKMTVYGETVGDVDDVKVYWEIFRDGRYIDNDSNSDNDGVVTLKMNYSGNDMSEPEGGPLWEVKSTHRAGSSKTTDYDSDYGKCGQHRNLTQITERPNELQLQLNQVWDSVIESHNLQKSDWLSYDITEAQLLQDTPPTGMSKEEIIGYLDGIDEASQYLKSGDSIPLYLINPKTKEGAIIFQRDFDKGKKVMVSIEKTKTPTNTLLDSLREQWGVTNIIEK